MQQLGPSTFFACVGQTERLPDDALPEIAFAGRSNVGKSSLLNALIGRRALARVSSTPGRTQTLNFIDVAGRLRLVDLPGYGYAKVPLVLRRQWQGLIGGYLAERRGLAGVVLILDIRREPSGDDLDLYDWLLELNRPVLPVATKADKLGKQQQAKARAVIARALRLHPSDVFLFSATERQGVDALSQAALTLAGIETP